MKRAGKWAIGIVLTATAAFAAIQTVSAPEPDEITPPPGFTQITEPPSPIPQIRPCAFVWATHDAPELTESFDAAVKALDPQASGRVDFFGEDCVHEDGTSTFGAMETDFHVRLPVDDLGREEEFGNWVAQVMAVVTGIPRDEISGNYGFVEFWFEKNEADHIVFRVPIPQYMEEGQALSGAELFRKYYTPP